ncbi:MAG TPA: type II CAAX endopeptidase family protein [Candidatus Paceibacterota bacterium]|nr:type II CAAX endopeptidase family protein [Verrucomicrobiota bacterium]HRY49657.1 type II CAAX endopeptidase family protein [Candidatus Paceibacterota bacterium]HSA01990.1 type II CAAX endopeptidase family protein [Candidatus Paceibacterota bacterium]
MTQPREAFTPKTQEHNRKHTLAALLLLVPAPSLGTAAAMFWWPELLAGKIIFLASKIWLVLLPVIWLRFVDREPLSWSPPRRGGFGLGIALGLLITLSIFAAYAIAQHYGAIDPKMVAERAARTGLNRPGIYFAGAFYWITVNSLIEEYVWRWFVFRKCEVLLGGKAAVIAAGLAFTAHHVIALSAQFNAPITLLASLGVFIGGATWSGLYQRYRSIWPGYVSHAIVDMPIFVIGYWLIFS